MKHYPFCFSLIVLHQLFSFGAMLARADTPPGPQPSRIDETGQIRFLLQDHLEHPFYSWPRTLLQYPIELDQSVDLKRQVLVRADTGERIPLQFSDIVRGASGFQTATLNFFSDLPSGARREFVLSPADPGSVVQPQVKQRREGNTIVLDSGVMRVRIPASQEIDGLAPGPVMQVSHDEKWIGSSILEFLDDRVTRIVTECVADGPLFIDYRVVYETSKGSRYTAKIRCEAGMEFVRFQENMEELQPGTSGTFTSTWSGFDVSHRQAPNHPFPLSDVIRDYDDYNWEKIDEPFRISTDTWPTTGGQLPFALGIYQRAPGNFRVGTFANFWNQQSDEALGVFIDNTLGWQDHQYAYEFAAPTLMVRYHFQDGQLFWKWPLARGRRSTCLAFYDHSKDQLAMRELERKFQKVQQDGDTYAVPLTYTSHTLFLQNRYGTLDLNRVKDWVLEYPVSSRQPSVILSDLNGRTQDPAELERRVMTSAYVCTLPVTGTRQMAGHGPIPGRSIVNFSPVPSRQIVGGWVQGFSQCQASLTERQRRRLTAMFLFLAHVHHDDEFMPLVNMLSGHPNFLADVKAVPPAMSFLFPDHPQAASWADMGEKCVELNTRFHTRPDVDAWQATGGRWTENLGTYVWAFLHPSLRTDFLLRQYDGRERFVSPQLASMTDWLVNSLSAPFNGESEASFNNLLKVDQGREWCVVGPGKGPLRVHPPQGAHSEQRFPPRKLWYLGTCLQRYAPLAAEHAMWASRPTDPDAEAPVDRREPFDVMYQQHDNRGTNPHLRSSKFTGYGIVLRAGVDTPNELSVHLQQIDQGPNYRWGRSGEGGCGIVYFYAGGKSYSYTGPEDVGDRDDQDTDFCTNFGVYKNGKFHSIGMNVLSRPLYDLGTGQFAEIVSREGPTAYASPEYLSRSVLLAGHEYFVLYDQVVHQALTHRLTWFVRKFDELPTIKLMLGAEGNRETQQTDVSTATSTGKWFDGLGDSMAVVSHRQEIKAEGTPFGCRVSLPGIDDLVFRRTVPVEYGEGDTIFQGTSGLIRKTMGKVEFSLFHGTRIGVAGLTFTTDDNDLGIGGSIVPGAATSGEYFAPQHSSVRIAGSALMENAVFYVDGVATAGRRESGSLVIALEPGLHHWELTESLPTPIAPQILRTENFAGGARVIVGPVGSATSYRLELSKDGGSTWVALSEHHQPELTVSGLTNNEKVQVRAVALNSLHESAPGPEYPLYVTNQPPLPPDGLRVQLSAGAATISWGEILGATEYRLYVRSRAEKDFQLLYRGLERSYLDQRAGIRPCDAIPGAFGRVIGTTVVEYCVTALNHNGESAKSHLADTNPASWRNWDPSPGEHFRRVSSFVKDSPASTSEWPRYYPK